MLQIVKAPDLDEDGEALPWSTLHALARLIPGVGLTFNGMDVRLQQHYFGQSTDADEFDESEEQRLDEIFWKHYADSHCSHPERTGDYRSVMMSTDFCSM